MKEAEVAVVEGVRAWWGEENRKGVGRSPIGLGEDNNALCPVLGLSCWAPKFASSLECSEERQ